MLEVAEMHAMFVSIQRDPACNCISAVSSLVSSTPTDIPRADRFGEAESLLTGCPVLLHDNPGPSPLAFYVFRRIETNHRSRP